MLIPFLNIVQAADGTGVYKFNDTNLYNALVEQLADKITGKNDENKHRITLQEVYDQLHEDRFIFVDRAVIVNIRKVDTYMEGILFMKIAVI